MPAVAGPKITPSTQLHELAIELAKRGVHHLRFEINPLAAKPYLVVLGSLMTAAKSEGTTLTEAIDDALFRFIHKCVMQVPL